MNEFEMFLSKLAIKKEQPFFSILRENLKLQQQPADSGF